MSKAPFGTPVRVEENDTTPGQFRSFRLVDAGGNHLLSCSVRLSKPEVGYIAAAINHHDLLAEALERAIEDLQAMIDYASDEVAERYGIPARIEQAEALLKEIEDGH